MIDGERTRDGRWGMMQKPRNGQWSSTMINLGYVHKADAERRAAWLNDNSSDGSEFAVLDRNERPR